MKEGAPTHCMKICKKFDYKPVKEVMCKMDSLGRKIIWEEEIQKITIVLPQYHVLVPRDSLTKIVAGNMDLTNLECTDTMLIRERYFTH